MLRGIIPAEIDDEEIEMTFYQLYNSFLAIYQVGRLMPVAFKLLTIKLGSLFGRLGGRPLCRHRLKHRRIPARCCGAFDRRLVYVCKL